MANRSNRDISRRYEGGSSYDWDYTDGPAWNDTGWWAHPGPYRGVGPKGYKRSDDIIREEIYERLTWHGWIDPSDIRVKVDSGEAVLEGTVDSRWTKRLAEDIIESVSGVIDIHNRLRIQESASSAGSGLSGGMRSSIQIGMEVFGRNGGKIGQVEEIHGSDFLLSRSMARDVYVPFNAILNSAGGRILLDVPEDQVNNQDWPSPDIVTTPDLSQS